MIFKKTNHSFTSSSDISCHLVFMYPHQNIASFHPTSKDGWCGARRRRNWTMPLCHIYCICVDNRWRKWRTSFVNLSLLYLEAWGHIYISFFWDIYVSKFVSSLASSSVFFSFSLFYIPCHFWRMQERRISSWSFILWINGVE